MAHDLTVQNGRVEMFSAGKEPVWHKLGQRTAEAVTSEEAIRLAGLNWEVAERSLEVTDPTGLNRYVQSHKAIVREDNNNILGIVGNRYVPIQNHEAFEWMDEIIGERLAVFETAGSIHGGRVVWIMVRLPVQLRVKGTDDISEPYVLLCNSHDGTRALRILNCSIRVVCNNTLTWALQRGEGAGLAIRHTESIKDRIEEARDTLMIATKKFQRTQQEMNQLNSRVLSDDEVRRYFEVVWPDNPEIENTSRSRAVRELLFENFICEPQRLPGIEGTAWAVVNAVSQFCDWQRPTRGTDDTRRDSNRLHSIWFGDSASVKRRAWSEGLKLTAN